MKRTILTLLFPALLTVYTNAQVVISNDYGTPVGQAGDLNDDVDWRWNDDYHRSQTAAQGNSSYSSAIDYEDPFMYAGLSWYNTTGTNTFGLNVGYLRWNGLGADFNVSTDESFKNFWDFNLNINYAFGLWNNDSSAGMITFAVGPSFYTSKTGDDGSESTFNLVTNPRFTIRVNHILFNLGYRIQFNKFKFKKENTSDAVMHFGIAYCF